MLSTFSLRSKLLLAFGLPILILLIFSSFVFLTLRDIKVNQVAARGTIQELRSLILQMRLEEQAFFTQGVTDEKNILFFNEGKSRYVDNWERGYQDFSRRLSLLNGQLQKLDLRGHNSTALPDLLSDYRVLFYQVVSDYRELGFRDFGLEGELDRAFNTLQAATPANLAATLRQARQREQFFRLRHHALDQTEFDRHIAILRQGFKNNGDSLKALERYQGLFSRVAKIEYDLGLTATNTLGGEHGLIEKETAITTLLTALEQTVLDKTTYSFDDALASLFILSFFIVISELVIAYWLYQSIIRPVQSLRAATQAFSEGKLQVHVPVTSRDELGELSASFNTMAKALTKSYHAISEVKDLDEAILSSIGDGVIVVNNQANIIRFNTAASNVSGFTEAEVIGKKYESLLTLSFIKNRSLNKIRSKKSVSYRVLVTKEGKKIAITDHITSLKDKDGHILGCVVVFRAC